MGVGHHDCSLRSPQQTCTYTKQCTSKDVEAKNIGLYRGEQAQGVDAVTDSTKGQGDLDSKTVNKCSTKEGKYGECAIEGNVLLRISIAVVEAGQSRREGSS